jgi:hypothetical protein
MSGYAHVGNGSKAGIKLQMIDVRFTLNSGPSSSGATPTALGASLTGFSITGITMIITGTSTSRCCSRLHRQRHPLQRRNSAAERQGAPPMRWLLRRCRTPWR